MYSANPKLIEGLESMPTPAAFSPHDYYRVQQAIEEAFEELKAVAPALTTEQKLKAAQILDIDYLASAVMPIDTLESFGIDEVSAQFALVKLLRDQVLSSNGRILEESSTKDVTSLINAINSTISLFMRAQEKIDHLREMQRMREATIVAMKEMPMEVQTKFFQYLDTFRAEGTEKLRGLSDD